MKLYEIEIIEAKNHAHKRFIDIFEIISSSLESINLKQTSKQKLKPQLLRHCLLLFISTTFNVNKTNVPDTIIT